MRKLLSLAAIVALVSCNDKSKETAAEPEKAAANVTYAYPVSYSSNFEMSDPARAALVTELWKSYDMNELDKHASAFADTMTMEMPGFTMTGSSDSLTAIVKAERGKAQLVESRVDAVFNVKSKDAGKDGDWVCIWGVTKTTKDNKVDSVRLQEIWHFNKDGKIDLMSQYAQQYPAGK